MYIQTVKNNKQYYLVYDTQQISINLLIYKIPISPEGNTSPFFAQLKNEPGKEGLVVLNGIIYSVAPGYYFSKATGTLN